MFQFHGIYSSAPKGARWQQHGDRLKDAFGRVLCACGVGKFVLDFLESMMLKLCLMVAEESLKGSKPLKD